MEARRRKLYPLIFLMFLIIKMPSFKNNRGFSFIEAVIYVSLLAAMAVLVVGSILSIYRIFIKTKVERSLNINADVALESMIREIRLATSTTISGSAFGSHPGSLRLNAKKFSLSGTILELSDSEGAPQSLTGDARITNLVFYPVTATSTNVKMIKIEMTLESGSGKFLISKNYNGAAVLRGSY